MVLEGGTMAATDERRLPLLPRDPPAPLEAPPAARARVPLFDNAKAFLIVFVNPIPFWSGLLAVLKAVVMPSFCLISGHLSTAELTRKRAVQLAQVFTTYVIFELLHHLNNMLSFRLAGFEFDTFPLQVFSPKEQVVTWFLLSLLLWRATLPVLVLLRAPVVCTFVLAHLALFADLGVNYQNLLAFMPYFVCGYYTPPSVWTRLAEWRTRASLAAFFCCACVTLLASSYIGGAGFDLFFERVTLTYACFNGAPPGNAPAACCSFEQLLERAIFYCASFPLIAGFLCVLPRQAGIWSVPGYMSMYVYLLHPFVLFNPFVMKALFTFFSQMYGREVNVWSPATGGGAVALMMPIALLVCVLLSTSASRALFWLLVEPPIERLFSPHRMTRPLPLGQAVSPAGSCAGSSLHASAPPARSSRPSNPL
ncbi:hypothetical protein AB1Y20_001952 [Prymnesium parvum]|uniref:Acyltransferase 3 domain-containing protein n=1 Tax=Prymnesium parvum TaxID=97485 RepID=A0AB34J813_PRYPA